MASLLDLDAYLKQFLATQQITDYCPNGLQVEGKLEIKRIVTGVTASRELIKAAIAADADALLVHHGYFWNGEQPSITGIKYQRVKLLIEANVSLLAYHLPLDIHKDCGNNAQLAKKLGLKVIQTHDIDRIPNLLWQGQLAEPMSGNAFAQYIQQVLQRSPLHVAGSKKLVKNVAWCTGGAQNYIEHAVQLGIDAYITGEASEQTVHSAQENEIHFYAAGHHATERYGIQALGEHLAQQFSLDHQFIDIDNPV